MGTIENKVASEGAHKSCLSITIFPFKYSKFYFFMLLRLFGIRPLIYTYILEKVHFKSLIYEFFFLYIVSPFLSLFQTSSWLCVLLFLERSVAQPKATISRFYFTKPKLIGEFRFVEDRKRVREIKL